MILVLPSKTTQNIFNCGSHAKEESQKIKIVWLFEFCQIELEKENLRQRLEKQQPNLEDKKDKIDILTELISAAKVFSVFQMVKLKEEVIVRKGSGQ